MSQLSFEYDDGKPPYTLPTMAEVRAVEPNGLNVVSTFSGCGGSCLGFRMAGFKVLWASEFVPAAAETYAANFPETPLDRRDIRDVDPAEILETIGLKRNELDVFEGSPPCSSFSLSGNREADWGKVKKYSDVEQRTDDLFLEYVRVLDGLRPRVFVAENVPGLQMSTEYDHRDPRTWGKKAGDFYGEICAALSLGDDYLVWSRVLNAAHLGVPQMRRRLIFVGVRRDVGKHPAFPEPLPYTYSIRDAIGNVSVTPSEKLEARVAGGWKGGEHLQEIDTDKPSLTITSKGMAAAWMGYLDVEPEPEPTEYTATSEKTRQLDVDVDRPAQTILAHGMGGAREWFTYVDDDELEGSLDGYAIGEEAAKLEPGQASAKYFNLVRPDADKPSPTVSATGGNIGAASVIHPDGKRKFKIAELRRLSGFPPDFALTGTWSQQWERIGRAVPPPMMKAIASTIRDEILT